MKNVCTFLIALASICTCAAFAAPPAKCCVEGNLAHGGQTKASSEETGKNNFARNAVDGDLRTRWCASSSKPNESWQVDFGKAGHVKSLRIHWEKAGTAYRYKVDASKDAEAWRTIVDQSTNKKAERITPHEVDSPDTRFLRITFLGSSNGVWGSFWEVEAYAGKLPELPKGVNTAAGPGASVADVQAPPGFDVTMFGAPPTVNYPVCLAAAPTGEVFVGVDEQGSLGKQKGRGKVIRCVDVDDDGVADKVNVFAKMDHPRGLVYDNGSLWVLHPPNLTVYHDDDRDGVADRHETLITGISTDFVAKRGADHTTNGIRMGIDGWTYIAVGDFGFTAAKGTDGTTLSRRGGGVVRVRPDGTEMEIYAWGLRNILDVAIDPYLNLFTRDNTNDGGGWDVRVSHVIQSAEYGYPSLYKNFAEEIMPPLGQYGGGSGCGGMYLHELRWPKPFGDAAYTCDWGTSQVYRHSLQASGATFSPHQEVFLKIPRPTDIDVDGSGRMYVSSWKNGKFDYSGPNVGFVIQMRPKDFVAKPFPKLDSATDEQLVGFLAASSEVYRLHSQREILRRGKNKQRSDLLAALAANGAAPLYGRVAAIFTLKQLDGAQSHPVLLKLAGSDASVREFALRAVTDRKSELDGVPLEPFLAALKDKDARVRAQALISLGRLGRSEAAEHILPLTLRAADSKPPTKQPFHAQPDPGRVIPHLAVRAVVATDGVEACLKGLDGPLAEGALWALRYMHNDQAVNGIVSRLSVTRDRARRQALLTTLIRLYHREGDYTGGWWGTRPDTSGPYFDRKPWSASPRIAKVVRTAASDADKATSDHILAQLAQHHVKIDGLQDAVAASRVDSPQVAIKIPPVDPANKMQIANMAFEQAAKRSLDTPGDLQGGRKLFTSQSCIACHTDADGQTPKGPHLVDIGKRYKRTELIESILKPSAKIAQGFDTYSFITIDGKVLAGFVVSESAEAVQVRQNTGILHEIRIDDIELRKKQEQSMMPDGLANNLTPEQLADLLAYLESLKSAN